MKLNKLFTFSFLFISLSLKAQESGSYFFPIRPGDTNFLAGTMGELRSTHFHAGIDIKTSGREGLPVYATASGYISRIKIAPDGYGNSLYLQHEDGNTSVYAHLQSFSQEIADWVREEQYKAKSFSVDLFPEVNQFKVARGSQIALSGNSGSSSGPHLHFEIRDANQNVLNPLKFAYSEIKDDIAPIAQKIALNPMSKESRVNQQYVRMEFDLQRNGTDYNLIKPIEVQGILGLELLAHDKLTGAPNKNGIPCIEVKLDGQRVFYQNIEQVSFNDMRQIYVHTNYTVTAQTGKRYDKLYQDDGNTLPFYQNATPGGYLYISDTLTHELLINLWDAYGNISSIRGTLIGKKPQTKLETAPLPPMDKSTFYVDKNTLVCIAEWENTSSAGHAVFYSGGMKYEVKPDYTVGNRSVFLWDLRYSLPDSADLCTSKEYFPFKALVPAKREFSYYQPYMEVHFSNKSLYDTLYLKTSYELHPENREIFTLNEDIYPLQSSIDIVVKPSLSYPNKEKTAVYATDDQGNFSFNGGTWQGENMRFSTRNLGSFTILTDTIPPKIKVLKQNKDLLSFVIDDELSGVASYELWVNNEWVLMNYDKKKRLVWSEKRDNSIPFKGPVQCKVRDNAGNEFIYLTQL
ncbi:M23 family metallopeptidase [Cytophagales bacterium LB-30]|uniref:M23 family metallopeptidase n=1 Tax=Shiella aurantiaca TaxID=3058365 RepID=A0ABT8F198_9BACT|nr:M23 family metallopeptidase [Shiella aurantiaca]MDN4164180.1 M23 family metallopeptidase [Shiella aurantiaca]